MLQCFKWQATPDFSLLHARKLGVAWGSSAGGCKRLACVYSVIIKVSRVMLLLLCYCKSLLGHIVVDVCALNDGNIGDIDMDSLDATTEHLKPWARRYVLPLNVESEVHKLAAPVLEMIHVENHTFPFSLHTAGLYPVSCHTEEHHSFCRDAARWKYLVPS